MNEDIENKVQLKQKLHDRYLRHKRNNEDFARLENLDEIDQLIYRSKEECYQYINRKLNDLSTSSKTYWSIMKTFIKNK